MSGLHCLQKREGREYCGRTLLEEKNQKGRTSPAHNLEYEIENESICAQ